MNNINKKKKRTDYAIPAKAFMRALVRSIVQVFDNEMLVVISPLSC